MDKRLQDILNKPTLLNIGAGMEVYSAMQVKAAHEVSKPKWIKTSDQIPGYGTTVLVYLRSGLITCAYISVDFRNGWQLFGDIDMIIDLKTDKVTHWMTLPQPPSL